MPWEFKTSEHGYIRTEPQGHRSELNFLFPCFFLRAFLQSLKNIMSSLQARAAQVTSMCPVDSHARIFIMEKSVTTVLIFGKLNFFKLCYSKVLSYSKYFIFRQILPKNLSCPFALQMERPNFIPSFGLQTTCLLTKLERTYQLHTMNCIKTHNSRSPFSEF